MSDTLLARIDETLEAARASGALQAIQTEQTQITDQGVPFTVRWVSSLARKDTARVDAAIRRDPDFNPFLPPDPDLTIGALGPEHLAVLNKFPVLNRHLLIVTRVFEAQDAPLAAADFDALACVMRPLGGLGFYNGGTAAGASQRHKHLQWIPDDEGFARLLPPDTAMPPIGSAVVNPALPWRHAFVRLPDPVQADGQALHGAFRTACQALHIDPYCAPMPPYNLLAGRGWLAVIPRSQEHSEGISINALGFAGSLFVRRVEEIDTVRATGPLRLLASVAHRR